MDKEETPDPRSNVFTAQDGIRLAEQLRQDFKGLAGQLSQIQALLATSQKNQIAMMEDITTIQAGLSESRFTRLELELREAELERDAAERNLRNIEKKVEIKQNVRDEQIDTHERIRQAATGALLDLEKQKKESDAAFYLELRRMVIKTIVVGVTGGILAFIAWLIRLYITQGG